MPESAARKAWMDANSTKTTIRIMHRTEADILEQLNKQPQKSAYIKRLIRDDIAAEKAAAKQTPEVIRENLRNAYEILKAREFIDNTMAAKRGMKAYSLVSVNYTRGDIYDIFSGYYVTINIEGIMYYIVVPWLSYEISKKNILPPDHYVQYDDDNVDFIFLGFGYSTVTSIVVSKFHPDGEVFTKKG